MNKALERQLSADAFEARYVASNDPWQFATSHYEQNRYDTLLRALSKPRYDVVYEPGCSIGVLTAELALRANCVIASDIAPSALKQAQLRCKHLANVMFIRQNVADFRPLAPLDLVIFSEIGYYFQADNLARIASALARCLRPQGEFLAAHWLGESAEHVLHGDAVHETLKSSMRLAWAKGQSYDGFRLDSWMKS